MLHLICNMYAILQMQTGFDMFEKQVSQLILLGYFSQIKSFNFIFDNDKDLIIIILKIFT